MKEGDIVRVTDERSAHQGQAGLLIYLNPGDDGNGVCRHYVQFFCGPYSSGHITAEALSPTTVEQLTDEEAAVLMRWELMK